jgi:hypothetical protein
MFYSARFQLGGLCALFALLVALGAAGGAGAATGFMLSGVKKQLFVSDNVENVINIYPQAGRYQQLTGQITQGLNKPLGMFIAAGGDLYVANQGDGTTSVYHRGALQPYERLSGGPSAASDVAVDSHGNVYVIGFYTPTIWIYSKGSIRPTASLTDSYDAYLYWIAIDSHDNIFVNGDSLSVEEFRVGSKQARQLTGITYVFPGGLAFGPGDVLAVCDGGNAHAGNISFYAPPYDKKSLVTTYPYAGAVEGIALLPNSDIVWGANYGALAAQLFNVKGRLIGQTSSRGLMGPLGVAVDPAAAN